ncbi:MAG: acyltransferase [Clostridiales bacterium]|nr:acyltransferase [Clostridiales bacterium]
MNCINDVICFDKRQTNIAKGIAVLLLLWHHVFYNNPNNYELFSSLMSVNGIPIESLISDFCKVCVAIFLILSGYGLCKSYESFSKSYGRVFKDKSILKARFGFAINHLLKLMFSFWFVYLVFVPLSIWFGTPFWNVYNDNILFGVLDFLGLSALFGTPTINSTWWFMGVIIVYYLLFPLLMKLLDYCGEILVAISACLLFVPVFYALPNQLSTWILPFTAGMYFSKNNLFEKCDVRINNVFQKCIFVFLGIISTALMRYINAGFDTLFAFAVIIGCYFLLSKMMFINVLLEHLGKYSGAIFMFHTFIYSYYFKNFIYSFKYAPLIFLIMVLLCYVIAVGLEWLKKLTRYDKLINRIAR